MDSIDRKSIDVAARDTDHDQAAIDLFYFALQPEDFRQRDLRYAASADGRYACAPDALERHGFAVRADDFFDRRAWDGEMLARDRDRERGNDRERQRHTQCHARPLAKLAVDLDDAADPFDIGT